MNIIFIEQFQIYKKFSNVETIGGIETNTKDVISELRKRGHNIWTPNTQRIPGWVSKGNVDIIAASTFDPLTYFQILKYKKKYNDTAAVVIHGHTTVEDLRGNFVPDMPIFNMIFKFWLKILYGTAHLLITPSHYSKKCLEQIQTSMTYPIIPVSNGIRLEEFEKEDFEKENYRTSFRNFLNDNYKVPYDAKIILNVGLSWKKKGVNTFGEIARRFPDYYFVWVGPINKNPDIDQALELDNVIFTGFYPDIRDAYFGSDLFLNTSYVENQGIPLIEAAICKLPIVARDLPAFDWVSHDHSCFKANNINEFTEGIKLLMKDKEKRNLYIKNAYEDAVKYHDFKKIGQKIENLYQKALRIKKIWDHKRKV